MMAEININMNDSASSSSSCDDANKDHDAEPKLNEMYKYVNKIFADQSLLLKTIENFFNEQIQNHKALIQKKTDEIDLLIVTMENRLIEFEDESIKINSIHDELSRMEERIKSLQIENVPIQKKPSEFSLTARLQNIANYSQDTKVDIDCDVLFIGDSNLKSMKEDIMNKGSKCQKIICFTNNEVGEY